MTDQPVTIGVVRESGEDERRVALVPKAIAGLIGKGVNIVIESGAESAPCCRTSCTPKRGRPWAMRGPQMSW
ncbi:Probable NAD(P) transhydrogenase%2C alpha1 subunit PntAA [Mycobacteroides abscessus]|nr:Probable NAD(P) transhydrogenase%2C alpha1 subunit PntAA [Mycobacteroides abscessus]